MNVLVTGAAGFIGSHLARTLAENGHGVVAFDIADLPDSLAKMDGIRPVKSDIRSASAFADAVRGCEVVFHQAAVASVPASFSDPAECMSVNVVGSTVVLEQSHLAGVRRVVMASTSAVYGDDPTPLKHEGLSPAPRSPYAVSKLAMEQTADVYSRQYGLETVALRYFNVYGPGQPANGGYAAVIPAIFQALTSHEPFRVFGDGGQTRSFVFVDDVVKANLMAADAAMSPEGGVLVANITSDSAVSLLGLIDAVENVTDTALNVEYLDAREGDIRHSRGGHDRASELLGFRAEVSLRDGLTQLHEFWR